MLDRIEQAAQVSVGRACGFAALATFMFSVGISTEMTTALKSAGILSLITCMVLLLKSLLAPRRFYKHTELWLMLEPAERPHSVIAQQVISTVLRETFLRFALASAGIAVALLALGLLLQTVRGPVALP